MSHESPDTLPPGPQRAWQELASRLHAFLADDLIAIWAHGSIVCADRPHRPADLDTYVVLARVPEDSVARRIEAALASIADAEFDIWFVTLDDAPAQ